MLPQFPLVGPRGRRPGCLRFRPALRGPCTLTYPVGVAPEVGSGSCGSHAPTGHGVLPPSCMATEEDDSGGQGTRSRHARPPGCKVQPAPQGGPQRPLCSVIFGHPLYAGSTCTKALSAICCDPQDKGPRKLLPVVSQSTRPLKAFLQPDFVGLVPAGPCGCRGLPDVRAPHSRKEIYTLSKPRCIQTSFNAREQGLKI